MRAEVIAVGTELLLGQIANDNAREISEALAGAGVDVLFHTTVGDNEERIAAEIVRALGRSDVVVITGGLGPTHDDLTREAISRATGLELERREELARELQRRFEALGRTMAASNLRQADQPKGANAIPNANGTAPGVSLVHKGTRLYALPGVPHEMRAMIAGHVLPELVSAGSGEILTSRTIKAVGLPESDVAERLATLIKRLDKGGRVTLALLASRGEVKVRLSVKARHDEAKSLLAPVAEEAAKALGDAVYGEDEETLEGAVARLLSAGKFTLSVAESVTGGLVASRLISIPGASDFLRAGYVTYSVEAKTELGVEPEVLKEFGSVSAETTEAMALAARERADTDFGLATTGEAGPDPMEGRVGTIFVGLASKTGSTSVGFRAPAAGRDIVRRWASQGALNLLRLKLLDPTEH